MVGGCSCSTGTLPGISRGLARYAGANVLAGTDTTRIVQAAGAMMDAARTWKNPFGDGKAAERIVKICDQVVRSKRG
jgi:UDP-N-acetylglucosamine 2-epimerase